MALVAIVVQCDDSDAVQHGLHLFVSNSCAVPDQLGDVTVRAVVLGGGGCKSPNPWPLDLNPQVPKLQHSWQDPAGEDKRQEVRLGTEELGVSG